eukprot:Nk52_evm30s1737 gene=Nk52_evmTU30s1737
MDLRLPPRWLNCPRKGQIIQNLGIVPFKTPLGEKFNPEVPEECRFTPDMLIDALAGSGIHLGMIIDLTKTNRYYDKAEFEKKGITHVKLPCEGFEAAPTVENAQLFIKIVTSFKSKPENEGKFIGLHCTHGFNRTGFLICCYLVEVMDWDVVTAVSAFAESRSPGIYKREYVVDLYERYDGPVDDVGEFYRPNWEDPMEREQGDDEPENPSGLVMSHNNKGSTRQDRRGPVHMSGIPGEVGELVTDHVLLADLKRTVAKFCRCENPNSFAGSQPVSLDKNNIRYITNEPFMVSWKADGTRYMMLIKKQCAYMVDRDNNFFALTDLIFPYRKKMTDFLDDTLLDGELVIDEFEVDDDNSDHPDGPESKRVRVSVDGSSNSVGASSENKEGSETVQGKKKKRQVPVYLIYDMMSLNGQLVGKEPYEMRLTISQVEIEKPRAEAKRKKMYDFSKEPFSIKIKKFVRIKSERDVVNILENLMPTLPHENDGLIFSPAYSEYITGAFPKMLKWKPKELNSVDFLLKVQTTRDPGCLAETVGVLYVGSGQQRVAFGQLAGMSAKRMQEMNGRIVECTWSEKPGAKGWVFMRIREDKSYPNAYKTAQAVCISITHGVTKDELVKFIAENKKDFGSVNRYHKR